jgi:hypothetical protein
MGCAVPDNVSHGSVISVYDPRFGFDRFANAADEFLRVVARQIAPVGLPIDGVEFDVGRAQWASESARGHRLTGS